VWYRHRQVSAAALSATSVPPSLGAFYHPGMTEDQKARVNEFVKIFLNCYDSNRDSLVDAYGASAVFSLTINSSAIAHGTGRVIRNAGGDTSAYSALQHDVSRMATRDPARSSHLFVSKVYAHL
jgi:hypothetical protein